MWYSRDIHFTLPDRKKPKSVKRTVTSADMSVVPLIMEVMMLINDETRRKLEELSLDEMIHALEIQSNQQSCVGRALQRK